MNALEKADLGLPPSLSGLFSLPADFLDLLLETEARYCELERLASGPEGKDDEENIFQLMKKVDQQVYSD
jgi:hypothetical protein